MHIEFEAHKTQIKERYSGINTVLLTAFSTEKLIIVHHQEEVKRQEKIRAEHEMEELLRDGKMLWN